MTGEKHLVSGHMKKRFKTPRVYFREFTYRGVFHSKMLGVAFTYAQGQKFRDLAKNQKYWLKFLPGTVRVTIRSAKIRSEKLKLT